MKTTTRVRKLRQTDASIKCAKYAASNPGQPSTYSVHGNVTSDSLGPLKNVRVVACQQTFCDLKPLTESTTDEAGGYNIDYTAAIGEATTHEEINLVVIAIDAKGSELIRSPVILDAKPDQKVDLVVPKTASDNSSELERMLKAIKPLLADCVTQLQDLPDTPDNPALTLLARAAHLAHDLVVTLAAATRASLALLESPVKARSKSRMAVVSRVKRAMKLTFSVNDAKALCYACFRSGSMPSLPALQQRSDEDIRQFCRQAIASKIVPRSVTRKLPHFLELLQAHRVNELLNAPPTTAANQSFKAAVSATVTEPTQQQAIADLAARHGFGTQSFWSVAAQDKRVPEPALTALRTANEFLKSVGNEEPLLSAVATRLTKARTPLTPDALVAISRKDWERIIPSSKTRVPRRSGVKKAVAKQRHLRAAALASRIERLYPTQMFRNRLTEDKDREHPLVQNRRDILAFLTNNPDFHMLQTPLPGLLTGDPAKDSHRLRNINDKQGTISLLSAYQRLYRLTNHIDSESTLDRHETVKALLDSGIESPIDMAAWPRSEFAKSHRSLLGDDQAKRLHDLANRIANHSLANSIQAKNLADPTFAVVLPKPAAWAQMFGPVELCECEDCSSMLSPAAYLFDTLRFLRNGDLIDNKTPFDRLIARRPDIQYIALTCANTNVRLPYIDLVNEILEQHVAPEFFQPFALSSSVGTWLDRGQITPGLRDSFKNSANAIELSGDAQVSVVAKHRKYHFSVAWNLVDAGRLYYIVRGGSVTRPAPSVVAMGFQTIGTEEERLAAPAHVIDEAYKKLAIRFYPWIFPFDLSAEEARAYLAKIGLKLSDILIAFGVAGLPVAAIRDDVAATDLNLSSLEWEVLSGIRKWGEGPAVPGGDFPEEFWGFPRGITPITGPWYAQLRNVREFLRRAEIEFVDLLELLDCYSINPVRPGPPPTRKIVIKSTDANDPATCELDKLTLAGLDAGDLKKIHLFLRLKRKLGWHVYDLDRALGALNTTTTGRLILIAIAQAERLRRATRVELRELLSWWADLDDQPYHDYQSPEQTVILSLYEVCFRKSPYIAEPDAVFGEDIARLTGQISDHTSALCASLGITEPDLDRLLSDTRVLPAADADRLNQSTLSALFRYTSFARAVGLSIEDLLTFMTATGIEPFTNAPTMTAPARVQQTLNFLDLLNRATSMGLTASELAYVMLDRGELRVAPGLTDNEGTRILESVRAALQKLLTESEYSSDAGADVVARELVKLGSPPADAAKLGRFFAGAELYEVSLTIADFGNTQLPSDGRVTFDAGSGRLQVTGVLSEQERDYFRDSTNVPGATNLYRSAVTDLFNLPRTFAKSLTDINVAVPTLSTGLSALPPNWTPPPEIADRLKFDPASRQLSFHGDPALLDPTTFPANTDLRAAIRKFVQDPPPNDVRVDPAPDANRFFGTKTEAEKFLHPPPTPGEGCAYALDRIGRLVWLLQSPPTARQALSSALGIRDTDLEAGTTIWSSLIFKSTAASDITPSDFVRAGGPITSDTYPDAFVVIRRLHKLRLLLQRLALPPSTSAWLISHSSAIGGPDFESLPASSGDLQLDDFFLQWISDFARVDREISNSRGELIDLVDIARRAPDTTRANWLDAVKAITNWDRAEVEALTRNEAFPAGFLELKLYERLLARMTLVRRSGVSATTLLDWYSALITAPSGTGVGTISSDMARQIKSAVQARLPRPDWLTASKDINDILRERRRDALVSYLMSTVTLPGGLRLEDKNELFKYLLIDTEMGACMLTSRIKQALNSVQTFVQRGILSLEPGIQFSPQEVQDWEDWRKQYRLWEANRKVLLYPENWLEPEFRGDRSEVFAQIESDLLSTELTSQAGELAVRSYIERLAELSGLDIVTAWATPNTFPTDSGQTYELIVIGRTSSLPLVHYQRRYIRRYEQDEGEWTPWQRIDLDIQSEHVVPVIWRGTPYLFWATLKDQPMSIAAEKLPPASLQIDMFWSSFNGKAWSPKKLYAGPPVSIRKPVNKTPGESLFLRVEFAAYSKGGNSEPVPTIICFQSVERTGPYGNKPPRVGPPNDTPLYSINAGPDLKINAKVEIAPGLLQDISANLVILRIGDTPDTSTTPYNQINVTEGTYNVVVSIPIPEIPNYFSSTSAGAGLSLTIDATRGYSYERTVIFTRNVASLPPRTESWRPLDMEEVGRFTLSPIEELTFVSNQTPGPALDIPAPMQAVGARFVDSFPAMADLELPIPPGEKVGAISGGYRLTPLAQQPSEITTPVFFVQARARTYELRVSSKPGSSGQIDPVTFFHPFTGVLLEEASTQGIENSLSVGLEDRNDLISVQYPGGSGPIQCGEGFYNLINPKLGSVVVTEQLPYDRFSFGFDEAYASYNWELFFHVPFLIAKQLLRNQRFAEARWWMHRIFDPTAMEPGVSPEQQPLYRFWRFKPFQDIARNPPVTLADLMRNETELSVQLQAWAANPFDSFAVAKHRPSAFMKAAVTTYLDILLAWGDQLFQRDTIEAMNEATQLYLLAAEILGKRPQRVPKRANPGVQTFASLSEAALNSGPAQGSIGAIAVEISSFIEPSGPADSSPRGSLGSMLYFCLNENEKLLAYWQRVEDRLFKLRQCLDIEGRFRIPALFEPAIDPALLIRAKAAGLSTADVLADLYAPLPHYRFSVLAQKATELCSEVKTLGAALLAALEKRDAEALVILRQRHELAILGLTTFIKEQQVLEAKTQVEALGKSREMIAERYRYYRRLLGDTAPTVPKKGEDAVLSDYLPSTVRLGGVDADTKQLAVNQHEVDQLSWLNEANRELWVSTIVSLFAGMSHMQPNNSFSMLFYSISFGGSNIGAMFDAISRFHGTLSANATHQASRDSLLAGFARRQDEWSLQANLAAREFAQIDKQTVAAEIRQAMFEQERLSHLQQIENAKDVDEFIRNGKFTNQQLYDWMVGQISTLYFQSHQFAYKLALRSQRAYQLELGAEEASFISFGTWDTLRRGLLAGEKLFQDIKQMEVAYLENNVREYEITKNVSLVSLDPLALIQLKATGECTFTIPEWVYDLDYPGHYLRRIKNVGVTIPCVVGPYAGVNCTLTLLSSSVRTTAQTGPNSLQDDFSAAQSIVTTTAQNDSGLFETNLRDERYLPFENRGAVNSKWQLRLPAANNSFDLNSVTDVILHIRYTAREGGSALAAEVRTKVADGLAIAANKPLSRAFSVRHEFPGEWQKFLAGDSDTLTLNLDQRFPLIFSKSMQITVAPDRYYYSVESNRIVQLQSGKGSVTVELEGAPSKIVIKSPASVKIPLDATTKPLDLFVVCNYSVTALP